MYIVVQHQISDPERFFAAAQQGLTNLPEGLTVRPPGGSHEGGQNCYLPVGSRFH